MILAQLGSVLTHTDPSFIVILIDFTRLGSVLTHSFPSFTVISCTVISLILSLLGLVLTVSLPISTVFYHSHLNDFILLGIGTYVHLPTLIVSFMYTFHYLHSSHVFMIHKQLSVNKMNCAAPTTLLHLGNHSDSPLGLAVTCRTLSTNFSLSTSHPEPR